jgi:hypothetical protein
MSLGRKGYGAHAVPLRVMLEACLGLLQDVQGTQRAAELHECSAVAPEAVFTVRT